MSQHTRERPLADVLLRNTRGFAPTRPERPPWLRSTLERVDVASTGNVVTVNLAVADRVHLRGLDEPSDERDFLEWRDWTPQGWGVGGR